MSATLRCWATKPIYPPGVDDSSATNDAMPRRTLPSLVVALLLATVPATAFADGAGDDQYQDPLAAPPAQKQTKKKSTTAPATTQTTATTTPSSAVAGTSTSGSSDPSPAPAAQNELPRTGAPAG